MIDIIPLFSCVLLLILFNILCNKNKALQKKIKNQHKKISSLEHQIDLLKPPTQFKAEDVAKAYSKASKLAIDPEKDFTAGLINSEVGVSLAELPEGFGKVHGIIIPSPAAEDTE